MGICERCTGCFSWVNGRDRKKTIWGMWRLCQCLNFVWMLSLFIYASRLPDSRYRFLPIWTGLITLAYGVVSYLIVFQDSVTPTPLTYGLHIGLTLFMLNEAFIWLCIGSYPTRWHKVFGGISWIVFTALLTLLLQSAWWRESVLSECDYEAMIGFEAMHTGHSRTYGTQPKDVGIVHLK